MGHSLSGEVLYGIELADSETRIGHPHYTVDAKYACPAAKGGENHTCNCVYRRAVCDGTNHLCMCGDDWTTPASCGCPEHHERNTMATPVGIEITAHKGEFVVEVKISSEVTVTPGSVLTTQLERAAKAMAVLLDDTRPSYDDDEPEF